MVARLDGRNFTRLTRDIQKFAAPFDERFRDAMVQVAEYLMTSCGFSFRYAYTQSDEISLLFPVDGDLFSRKLRKLNSVLAGEASARFTHLLQHVACFDCRISQLPAPALVVDYFRWRQEDAFRNALNAHCYWHLRGEGLSARAAHDGLSGMSVAQKNEFLFRHGINFNDLPNWQKRGVGLYWENHTKSAMNPISGKEVTAIRRHVHRDQELPMGDAYGEYIRSVMQPADAEAAQTANNVPDA
jgi:tRNA(His) 5'-end guanylyltransferase